MVHQVTETDRAWAAGFYDGEGCTSLGSKKRNDGSKLLYPRCALAQTDKQLSDLHRFFRIVGVGALYENKPQRANWSHGLRWAIGSLNDMGVCQNLLWPYLGEYKRSQWEQCIAKARASRTPKVPGDRAHR